MIGLLGGEDSFRDQPPPNILPFVWRVIVGSSPALPPTKLAIDTKNLLCWLVQMQGTQIELGRFKRQTYALGTTTYSCLVGSLLMGKVFLFFFPQCAPFISLHATYISSTMMASPKDCVSIPTPSISKRMSKICRSPKAKRSCIK